MLTPLINELLDGHSKKFKEYGIASHSKMYVYSY